MLSNRDHDDIAHKYAESVLFYDGKPVYLQGEEQKGGKIGIAYYAIGPGFGRTAVKNWADINDDKFSEGPFRLGYINDCDTLNDEGVAIKKACFCVRAPIRKWKQGLTANNMVFKGHFVSYNKALTNPAFISLLLGEFPTFVKAVREVSVKHPLVAYHRHWAIGQDSNDLFELHYRGSKVGASQRLKDLAPGPKSEYLQEAYEASRQKA